MSIRLSVQFPMKNGSTVILLLNMSGSVTNDPNHHFILQYSLNTLNYVFLCIAIQYTNFINILSRQKKYLNLQHIYSFKILKYLTSK